MLRGIQWPQTSAAHSQDPASGASTCSSSSPSQLVEVVPFSSASQPLNLALTAPGLPPPASSLADHLAGTPGDGSWGSQWQPRWKACGCIGLGMYIQKEAWPLQSKAGNQEKGVVRESNIFNSPTRRQCFRVATLQAKQL